MSGTWIVLLVRVRTLTPGNRSGRWKYVRLRLRTLNRLDIWKAVDGSLGGLSL